VRVAPVVLIVICSEPIPSSRSKKNPAKSVKLIVSLLISLKSVPLNTGLRISTESAALATETKLSTIKAAIKIAIKLFIIFLHYLIYIS